MAARRHIRSNTHGRLENRRFNQALETLGETRNDARYYTKAEISGAGGAALIGHHLDSAGDVDNLVKFLDYITAHWLLEGGAVSDEGGLNIQWTAGEVYSADTDVVAYFDARGTNLALTDDVVNILYYNGTTTLQVKTGALSGNEIEIAHAHCANGDIVELHQEAPIGDALTGTLRSLSLAIPTFVTNGLVVSEDVDVTNPLDVSQSAGTYYRDMHEAINVAKIDSRTSAIRRWHQDGGGVDFTYDTDAEIDTGQYDNAGTLANIPAAKWVRTVFFTDGTYIHWVYAVEFFTTITAALNADDPPLPTGLGGLPTTTSLVYQQGDAALPAAGSDQWMDARPIIGASGSNASITDHGALGGVTADQHHNESHTVASHSDTTGTGAELDTLTDGSDADALHRHDTLVVGPGSATDNAIVRYDETTGKLVQDSAVIIDDSGNMNGLASLQFASSTGNIYDDEGKIIISAVRGWGAGIANYFVFTNASAGSGPLLLVTNVGGDANVDFFIAAKGTGAVKVLSDLDVTGDIIVSGTVDGVDVAAHAARHTDGNDDIQDADDDGATKGICAFNNDDFDVAAGVVSISAKRRTQGKLWNLQNPLSGDEHNIHYVGSTVPITLTRIGAKTQAATNCVIQLYWYTENNAPTRTDGTAIMSANLTAVSGSVTTQAGWNDDDIPAGSIITAKVISVEGTPIAVQGTMEFTEDQ